MIIRNLWLFLSTVSFIACIGYSKTHNIGNPNLICNRTVLPPCNGSIKPNPVLLSAANGLENASHLEADMEWRRIKKKLGERNSNAALAQCKEMHRAKEHVPSLTT